MFPENLERLVAEQLALIAPKNYHEESRKITQQAAAEFSSRGMARSGPHAMRLWTGFLDFHRVHVETAFKVMDRVLMEVRPQPYHEFRDDIVARVWAATDKTRTAVSARMRDPGTFFGYSIERPPWQEHCADVKLWLEGEASLLVARLERMEKENQPHVQVHYINQTGSNARVNITSRDSSLNIENSGQIFELLRKMKQRVPDAEKQREIEAGIVEMEQAKGNKEKFQEAYYKFISIVADHMQVFGSLVPALTALCQQIPS